ncbi:MAG: DUF2156 domain-containing protein [Chloroflexi bacterium]|nr:MAG: DUF2156 domain-containing protein [Chloroflexota bacterium]MBL1193044.1 DUF2156 domain-containing protein [Chloroflexota bacterium]NOH10337.1 DUF2156 domain-containing protein [Chloroflexota bacterium]
METIELQWESCFPNIAGRVWDAQQERSKEKATPVEKVETRPISQLPRSWARTKENKPSFNIVRLPFSSLAWIPTAEIPHNYSFDQIYHQHLKRLRGGFVLQSCSPELRDYLIGQGCEVAAMGAEAILDLPWRGKRSVRELAQRGRRNGRVREVEINRANQQKLRQLLDNAPARQGTLLKHTERDGFDAGTRCFVFETPEKKWLGAVTLSMVASDYYHTELLLRHQDAPIGIMEALVTAIAEQLSLEGVSHLSLGAVTPLPEAQTTEIFSNHRHPHELWTHSQLAFRLGRLLNFAFNAEGLWRFKNKFSPRWQPVYLCASPQLTWPTIIEIVHATGYFNLVQSRLLETWPKSIPLVGSTTSS